MATTQLDFISLQVRDRARSEAFYRDQLGFQVAEQPNPSATVFRDSKGAIFAVRDPFAPLPPTGELGTGVGIWFTVSDRVEKLADLLAQADVRILRPPYDTPFGRSITVADPDGYAITLHEQVSARE